MQGSSIHHEYQVLRAFGVGLQPRYVFVFFLANDIGDLGILSVDELTTFLATPVGDHTTPYVRPARRRGVWRNPGWYVEDLYVVRAYEFLRYRLRTLRRGKGEASAEPEPPRRLFADNARLALQLRFHLHALRKMQDLADRNAFALVQVFIDTGWLPDEAALEETLTSFSAANRLAFLSLRPVLGRALQDGEGVFLTGDGHFSDLGARLVARALAGYVADHPAGPPGRTP
jgi:lysophospholipase L1-like esterase